jgi:Trypsin-co-occurring domain 2
MGGRDEAGLGLTEAVQALRAELLAAQRDPVNEDVRFPVQGITIVLQVVATRSADGRAGFKVPIIDAELGGSVGWQKETFQTVTVEFGPPVDSEGNPIAVASASDEVKG